MLGELVLLSAAAHRLWVLWLTQEIFRPLRERLEVLRWNAIIAESMELLGAGLGERAVHVRSMRRRLSIRKWIGFGVGCPNCTSVWAPIVVMLLWWHVPMLGPFAVLSLVVSEGVTIINPVVAYIEKLPSR